MRSLFYRKDPQLSDYLGLGLFLVAYLAVIGLVFVPRVYPGATAGKPGGFVTDATRIAVSPGPVVR
ncbi:MAG TPA: hypothetical protein VGC40_06815 [Paenirhodobacter sp.]